MAIVALWFCGHIMVNWILLGMQVGDGLKRETSGGHANTSFMNDLMDVELCYGFDNKAGQ